MHCQLLSLHMAPAEDSLPVGSLWELELYCKIPAEFKTGKIARVNSYKNVTEGQLIHSFRNVTVGMLPPFSCFY